MQTRQILALGQKGAKKFLEHYSGQLICARIRYTELQRRVKQAGGKWKSTKRVWEIHYDQAVALGLKKRIVKLEVSDIRHHQVFNLGRQPRRSWGWCWRLPL